MIKQKKLALLFILWSTISITKGQVTQDSVNIKTNIPAQKTEINLKTEPERQRTKNGIIVFGSCLFIVTTTILLYNVRSK